MRHSIGLAAGLVISCSVLTDAHAQCFRTITQKGTDQHCGPCVPGIGTGLCNSKRIVRSDYDVCVWAVPGQVGKDDFRIEPMFLTPVWPAVASLPNPEAEIGDEWQCVYTTNWLKVSGCIANASLLCAAVCATCEGSGPSILDCPLCLACLTGIDGLDCGWCGFGGCEIDRGSHQPIRVSDRCVLTGSLCAGNGWTGPSAPSGPRRDGWNPFEGPVDLDPNAPGGPSIREE